MNRKMFSLGASRAADLALLEGERLEGVDTEPLPGESLSSARAAFCRRVRALILCVSLKEWTDDIKRYRSETGKECSRMEDNRGPKTRTLSAWQLRRRKKETSDKPISPFD